MTLDSSARANPLGGSSPCVLRTMTSAARLTLGDRVGLSSSIIVAGNSIEIGEDTILGAGSMVLDNDFHSSQIRDRFWFRKPYPKLATFYSETAGEL